MEKLRPFGVTVHVSHSVFDSVWKMQNLTADDTEARGVIQNGRLIEDCVGAALCPLFPPRPSVLSAVRICDFDRMRAWGAERIRFGMH